VSDPKVRFEHPTQLIASIFLRAIAEDDAPAIWSRLSRESRGLLEGSYAARANVAIHRAAGVEDDRGDARLAEVVAPLRESTLAALGGVERLNALGVSAARMRDRASAYVLLLPDFGEERIVAEDEWKPAHALAFVHESREWLVDVGATAALAAEVELPDPLGEIR
jgi:hypothetical protein